MKENHKESGPGNVHLSSDDFGIIVSWMEVSENYEAAHGTSGKTSVGGKPKVKKKEAFKALAAHLLATTTNPALTTLTGRNMQQRWRTFMQRFKRTFKAHTSETGLGLTKADIRKGVLTISQKLEIMCPQYSRMKALFGTKLNVTAKATKELGVPPSLRSAASETFDTSDDLASGDETSDGSSAEDCGDEMTPIPAAQSQFLPSPSALENETPRMPQTPEQPAVQEEPISARTTLPTLTTRQGVKRLSSSPASQDHKPKRLKKNGAVDTKKQQPPTAHETRLSLSVAYARNAAAKSTYLQQKLEEEKRQWDAKQAAESSQREAEASLRKKELEKRRAQRHHELMLELLRQKKSMDEIEAFVAKFG